MRRIIAYIFLMNILLLSMEISVLAGGDDHPPYKGFRYEGDSIMDYLGNKKKITVPTEIYGEKITSVSNEGGAKNVIEIQIPEYVSNLSVSDFPVLEKVIISPKNKYFKVVNDLVVDKSEKELISCPGGKEKVNIPHTITEVSGGAFRGSKISEIVLEKNIEKIGGWVFQDCKELISVTLNENITKIPAGTFNGCSKLKEITLPKNLTKIGCRAFEECSKLEKIILPQKITYIEESNFSRCSSLKEIILPKGVTFVESHAFFRCIGLKTVTIENEEQAPEFDAGVFAECNGKIIYEEYEGISFYVPNRKVADELSQNLLCTGIEKAKIYVGDECIYEEITGTEDEMNFKYYEDEELDLAHWEVNRPMKKIMDGLFYFLIRSQECLRVLKSISME